MKTMTLLAALALVALVSGATPASAFSMAQTREDGAACNNCATPMQPAQRIAYAGLTISRVWDAHSTLITL